MDGSTILGKTQKGADGLAQRTAALPQKLRSVLILVDGKTAYAELLRKFSAMPQCDEHLAWLLENGFIQAVSSASSASSASASTASIAAAAAPVAAQGATSARYALLALAHQLLGAHAATVVQRLQDTDDTSEALALTLARCHKLIRLSIDEKKAEQFLK